jgi:hypothetical protein
MVSLVFTAFQNVVLLASYLVNDTKVCVTYSFNILYNIFYIFNLYILFITFCRSDKSKPYKACISIYWNCTFLGSMQKYVRFVKPKENA